MSTFPASMHFAIVGRMKLVLIAHDIRSAHNVGALLRTAEGLGVRQVYLTGYTPYPQAADDQRLPHIRAKLHKQIQKTALGAEVSQAWTHQEDIHTVLGSLKKQGFTLAALEQTRVSTPLPSFKPTTDVALLIGREVEGIDPTLLSQMDLILEIPMAGKKESFNVVQAAAMALYQCRFFAK
jgi:23S rRNA (guanosine2251-2'-O)-methyltransferase